MPPLQRNLVYPHHLNLLKLLPIHWDAWVVMPNHLHGILAVTDIPGRDDSRIALTERGTNRKSLGRLIGAFKTVSTKRINLIRNTPGSRIWQRNYYERIVRSEEL